MNEDDKEACTDVVEAEKTIITGPPAEQCQVALMLSSSPSSITTSASANQSHCHHHQEDNERFCFCGKKGTKETSTWKYLCGECRQNKPFSFKVMPFTFIKVEFTFTFIIITISTCGECWQNKPFSFKVMPVTFTFISEITFTS